MLLALLLTLSAYAQTPSNTNTVQMLMRQKLAATHDLLTALLMKDMNGIKAQTEVLSEISKATTWYKTQDPDFLREAASFRNSVEFMQESASAKDIPSTALGYVRVTMSCMTCHNFIRDVGKK
jgi:cytochrome c556